MDQHAVITAIVIALAVIAGLAFYFFRRHQNVKTTITGPAGTSVTVEASTKPGSASVEGVKSGGQILAESQVGGDARIANSEAASDATARTSSPARNPPPKA